MEKTVIINNANINFVCLYFVIIVGGVVVVVVVHGGDMERKSTVKYKYTNFVGNVMVGSKRILLSGKGVMDFVLSMCLCVFVHGLYVHTNAAPSV